MIKRDQKNIEENITKKDNNPSSIVSNVIKPIKVLFC
jgi:hypothetical protein